MRVSTRFLVPAAMAVFLSGCDNSIPKGKEAFVGHWQGPGLDLEIASTGKVKYKFDKGENRGPVETDLQAFHGDDMEVGSGPITTTLKVSAAPHQDGGAWKMTVDGIEVSRQP
jgi:hypothetical protein